MDVFSPTRYNSFGTGEDVVPDTSEAPWTDNGEAP